MPIAFFHNVLLKTLSTERPVVYVLPETHEMHDVFAGFPEGTVPRDVQHASVQALGLR